MKWLESGDVIGGGELESGLFRSVLLKRNKEVGNFSPSLRVTISGD